jgi:hypothetical protein
LHLRELNSWSGCEWPVADFPLRSFGNELVEGKQPSCVVGQLNDPTAKIVRRSYPTELNERARHTSIKAAVESNQEATAHPNSRT